MNLRHALVAACIADFGIGADPAGADPAGTEVSDELDCASGRVSLADVPHTTGTVEIDGALDDDPWCDALIVELDVETSPRENVAPDVRTFAYLIEDGSRLLVAFDALDPDPGAIRAFLSDRDASYRDDFVGVVLDTFNDQRRAFEFFVNPLGVQMDLIQDDVNRNESDAWDAIWESAGQITETGYTVEMAIPFSQLRFPSGGDRQTWAIDVLRFYPRQDRARISNNPLERGRNCYLCQLSTVSGFAGATSGKDLEIVPSLTSLKNEARDPAGEGGFVNGSSANDVGLNVRWGITPDLTANLALNPDFSQVEADVPQLDVNNQFALFFPETRPFFIEGADFFATPINAVFTRTISDPDIAAKLTGRSGKKTYGVFVAEDATTNLLFPGALGSETGVIDDDSRSLVGRYRHGFGDSSTIGALITSRRGASYRNDVGGFDGRYRISDRHTLQFQYLQSSTLYPDDISADFEQPTDIFDGDATSLRYEYQSREWFAFASNEVIDPGFRADLGFVSRVDSENRTTGFRRTWHGDGDRWWNQLRIGANTGRRFDSTGQKLQSFREVFGGFNGALQSFSQFGVSHSQEYFDGRIFDRDNFFLFGQVWPIRGLSISMSVTGGDQIDYLTARLGRQRRLQPGMDWNVNRHLLVRLQHTAQTLDRPGGPNLFQADLSDLRVSWQFNVRSFLRFTLQRQEIERNLDEYPGLELDAHSLTLGRQLLYSYKLNPQSVFYLGYSDNLLGGDDLAGRIQTDRTLFAKFSFAWLP